MSYRHITFDQSEVLQNFKKISMLEEEVGWRMDSRVRDISPEQYDQIQLAFGELVLDSLGFIPFYGDILDCVRGIYYLTLSNDEDHIWNGIFSLFAAIPLAGSVTGIFAAKPAFKGFIAAKKAGTLKTWINNNKELALQVKRVLKEIDFRSFKEPLNSVVSKAQKFIKIGTRVANVLAALGITISFITNLKKSCDAALDKAEIARKEALKDLGDNE